MSQPLRIFLFHYELKDYMAPYLARAGMETDKGSQEPRWSRISTAGIQPLASARIADVISSHGAV